MLLHFLVLLLATSGIELGRFCKVDDFKVVILILVAIAVLVLGSAFDVLAVLGWDISIDTLDNDLELLHINRSPLVLADALHIVRNPFGVLVSLLSLATFQQTGNDTLLVR